MMPTVMSAPRAAPPRLERTNGLAAAPPRKVRRESECLIMNNLPDGRSPAGAVRTMLVRSFGRRRFSPRQPRDLRRVACVRGLGVARQHRAEIELRVAALIQQRAVLDRTKMMVHDGDGGVGIAPAQRRDDLAMLVDGAIGRMRPAIQRQDQRAARHHFAEIAPQQAVARHLAELDMKFAGQPDRYPRLACLARGLFLADMTLEEETARKAGEARV